MNTAITVITWISDHPDFSAAIAVAVLSEAMALNPKWKYNGILQALMNMVMKLFPAKMLLLLVVLCLTSCASLNDAGTARYRLAPYTGADGQERCCAMEVVNGKNVGHVKAHIKGPDYDITLEETGVDAAHSQAIAAGAATGAAEAVAPLLKMLAPRPP